MNKKLNSIGINKTPKDTTVVVAMSGGVDSSVTLLKIIEMGYDPIGITMKLWEYKNIGGHNLQDNNCCAVESINNAKLVCDRLGVPHYTIDFTEDFKENVIENLIESGKEIIEITEEQNHRFAGNMLQVMGDKPYLVMSNSAYNSLSESQIKTIENYCPIIHSPLDTIEACGGGSARCMMAEIFLPKK